jgi:ribosome-associated protein
MSQDKKSQLDTVAQAIFDKKGSNILCLDVRGISSLTDYVIIAEGNVDKHVIALAQTIIEALKEKGLRPIFTEGMQNGDWVVLDYLEFMVHLFMPGLRDKYQLEQLWKEGKIVDLHIDVQPMQLKF